MKFYKIVVKTDTFVQMDSQLLKDEKGFKIHLGNVIKNSTENISHDILEDIINNYNDENDACLWSHCEEDAKYMKSNDWGSNHIVKITIDEETRYYEVI